MRFVIDTFKNQSGIGSIIIIFNEKTTELEIYHSIREITAYIRDEDAEIIVQLNGAGWNKITELKQMFSYKLSKERIENILEEWSKIDIWLKENRM